MADFLLYLLFYSAVIAVAWFCTGFLRMTAELWKLPEWVCTLAAIVGWVLPFAIIHALKA